MASPFSLADLVEHVRSRRADGDPLAQLAEATTVAEHVTELADELVGHFVDEARGAGASWTQIGESLGVTKQAAQKRFVGNASATAPPPRQRPDWIGDRTAVAVQRSEEEARTLGHAFIGVEHLILAALHDGAGPVGQALQDLGLSPTAVRAAIVAAIPAGSGPVRNRHTLPFTPRAKEMMFDARGIAQRYGHRCVEPEHILLKVLSGRKGGPVLKALNDVGLTDKKLKDWLAAR